jgi:type I phosphodiesterase/nucleotide pyrophosphatase
MTRTALAPPLPSYGVRSLSDLLPAVLSSLGTIVDQPTAPLGLPALPRVCVLMVDGLGWELLRTHAPLAPFLSGLAESAEPMTAGFPATTVTSLVSLGTGLTPGEHGMLGYTFAFPGAAVGAQPLLGVGPAVAPLLLNALRWGVDLDPLEVQPRPTWLERAARSGVTVTNVGPARFAGSPLTLAGLRGGRYEGAELADDRAKRAIAALDRGHRSLVYVYWGELDAIGHRLGCGSPEWREQLAEVDRIAAMIAEALPSDGLLVVTADHGMVDVDPEDRVDVDAAGSPLRDGVVALAGEARARHVHARPGAAADVLATWRSFLGDRMWVRGRDEAVAEGWFGPFVPSTHLGRIGDVVAAAHGPIAVVAATEQPGEAGLVGVHGSMTPAEQLVPLLMVAGRP